MAEKIWLKGWNDKNDECQREYVLSLMSFIFFSIRILHKVITKVDLSIVSGNSYQSQWNRRRTNCLKLTGAHTCSFNGRCIITKFSRLICWTWEGQKDANKHKNWLFYLDRKKRRESLMHVLFCANQLVSLQSAWNCSISICSHIWQDMKKSICQKQILKRHAANGIANKWILQLNQTTLID